MKKARKRFKLLFQEHHPFYLDELEEIRQKDYTIPLSRGDHLLLTRKQNMKPTGENLHRLLNLIEALFAEYIKMRARLKNEKS